MITKEQITSMNDDELAAFVAERSVDDLAPFGGPVLCESCGKLTAVTRDGRQPQPGAPRVPPMRGRRCLDCDPDVYLVHMELSRREWEQRRQAEEAERVRRQEADAARRRLACDALNAIPVDRLQDDQLRATVDPARHEWADDARRAAAAAELLRREQERAERARQQRLAENHRRGLAKIAVQCGEFYLDKATTRFVPTNPSQERAYEQVKQWITDPRGTLILAGPSGVGKTHMAARMFGFVLSRGEWTGDGEFYNEADFLEAWRQAARDETDFVEKDVARTTPFLVLDDLGTDAGSEKSLKLLYGLIDYRVRHNLPIVITTNLAIDGLNRVLGEKLLSRLLERGAWITLDGVNLRTSRIDDRVGQASPAFD